MVQRGAHAALLGEADQIARGRERQFEAAALAALYGLARRNPDRVGGLPAVMGAELIGRRRGEEEPGIEAFGHALRRDPVRVGNERVERELEAVVVENFQEADLVLVERDAMAICKL